MAKGNGSTRTSAPSGAPAIDTNQYIDRVYDAAKVFVQQQRQVYNQVGTLSSDTDIITAATQLRGAFKEFDSIYWQTHNDYVQIVRTTGDRSGVKEFESERRRHEDYTKKSYDKTVDVLLKKADTYGVRDKVKRILTK